MEKRKSIKIRTDIEKLSVIEKKSIEIKGRWIVMWRNKRKTIITRIKFLRMAKEIINFQSLTFIYKNKFK